MPDAADDQTWSVAEAKAHLSEEWQHKSARSGSLAEFFATSPLPGSELDLELPDVEPLDVAL